MPGGFQLKERFEATNPSAKNKSVYYTLTKAKGLQLKERVEATKP